MNMTTTTNTATITELNSVVLANITMHRGSTSKKCKATEFEIASGKDADQKKLNVSYKYLDHPQITEARAILNRVAKEINKISLTCPSIQGARYVKSLEMDTVNKIVDTAEAELHATKHEIINNWQEIVDDGIQSMAKLGRDNAIEWPTAEEFTNTFSIKLDWMNMPAPVADTILETVSDEAASRARAAQATDKMFLKAHAAPVRDLVVALAKAAEATTNSTQKGKRLRQDNFDNIVEALDNVSSYNWLDVPELNDLVRSIKASVGDVDGPSLPREERVAVASKLKDAQATAIDTLADLGI